MRETKKQHKNTHKRWSEEDVKYLKDNYGRFEIEALIYHLDRSEQSIKGKVLELFGSKKVDVVTGYFTTKEVASILGVTRYSVAIWIRKLGLPAITLHKKGNSVNETFHQVNPQDIWDWLYSNRHRVCIDTSKIKRGVIKPEPLWLKQDIRDGVKYGGREKWTKEMRAVLYDLRFNQNLTYQQCADILGRSKESISKQISIINNMKTSELKLKGIVNLT